MNGKPDIDLIRMLVKSSFPRLSAARIRSTGSQSTDNYIYRIDEDLCLRIARSDRTAPTLLGRERVALKELSGLALETPKFLALGTLAADDNRPWIICTWLQGKEMEAAHHSASEADARRLALFLLDLQGCKKDPARKPTPDNHWRGTGLARRDALTRKAIVTISDEFDAGRLRKIWHRAVNVETCPPADYTWVHGDLHRGNLIVRDGALTGVIDWGLSGLGDPACDLMAGFTVFCGAARATFANAMNASDSAWQRGRGWALSTAAIALAHYRHGDTPIIARSRAVIQAVLDDDA